MFLFFRIITPKDNKLTITMSVVLKSLSRLHALIIRWLAVGGERVHGIKVFAVDAADMTLLRSAIELIEEADGSYFEKIVQHVRLVVALDIEKFTEYRGNIKISPQSISALQRSPELIAAYIYKVAVLTRRAKEIDYCLRPEGTQAFLALGDAAEKKMREEFSPKTSKY